MIAAFQVSLTSKDGEERPVHRAFLTEQEADTTAREWMNDEWPIAKIRVGTWFSAEPGKPSFFVATKDQDPVEVKP